MAGVAIGLLLGLPAGIWARGWFRFGNPWLNWCRRLFLRAFGFALVLALIPGAHAETCTASVYSTHDAMQTGTRTASGIPLDDGAMTAAHRLLPFRSQARVTNTRTGRAITVMVTDRGPYWPRRCIDLTRAAARAIGIEGTGPVTVERE
jgi:rare lipoprotein A